MNTTERNVNTNAHSDASMEHRNNTTEHNVNTEHIANTAGHNVNEHKNKTTKHIHILSIIGIHLN